MSQTGSAVTIWRKSTRCESQQCVEVARVDSGMAVRNSTDPSRHIVFDVPVWQRFLDTLGTGDRETR